MGSRGPAHFYPNMKFDPLNLRLSVPPVVQGAEICGESISVLHAPPSASPLFSFSSPRGRATVISWVSGWAALTPAPANNDWSTKDDTMLAITIPPKIRFIHLAFNNVVFPLMLVVPSGGDCDIGVFPPTSGLRYYVHATWYGWNFPDPEERFGQGLKI